MGEADGATLLLLLVLTSARVQGQDAEQGSIKLDPRAVLRDSPGICWGVFPWKPITLPAHDSRGSPRSHIPWPWLALS